MGPGRLAGVGPAAGIFGAFMQKGDTSLLIQLQNDAFTGSWGFSPNTEEQIEHRTHMPNTSKAGLLFLFAGENPAGLPLDGDGAGQQRRARYDRRGSPIQGEGLSRHIMQAGMKHLRSVGLAEIGLEVEGNNDPAARLYISTGLKILGERHWFERVLPGT